MNKNQQILIHFLCNLYLYLINFDINPKVNFKLLSSLKKESKSEYNK